MENKDNDIRLNNISESELEGVKQFIKTQLDEMVLPYIYEKKLMLLDKNNKVYQEYLGINADTDKLLKIFNDVSLTSEQKKNQINKSLINLYSRTKDLIINVSNDQNKINPEEYNQFKIK